MVSGFVVLGFCGVGFLSGFCGVGLLWCHDFVGFVVSGSVSLV